MRVDLLLTDRKFYTFEASMAQKIKEEFEQRGLSFHEIYLSDGVLHDYLGYVKQSPPDWTLSFNELTPKQIPLCDVLRILHFYWVEKELGPAIGYLNSQFGTLGVPEKDVVASLNHPRCHWLPHGLEVVQSMDKKQFQVVCFDDLVDTAFLWKKWEGMFEQKVLQELQAAIDSKSPLVAQGYYGFAELYLKASETLKKIAPWRELPLSMFGEHVGNNWLKRLPRCVNLMSKLPYCEHFEVLKMSTFLLTPPESPWFWHAVASGCLPVESEEQARFFIENPTEKVLKLEALQKACAGQTWAHQVGQLLEIMQGCKK